jgi:hypothetical protein
MEVKPFTTEGTEDREKPRLATDDTDFEEADIVPVYGPLVLSDVYFGAILQPTRGDGQIIRQVVYRHAPLSDACTKFVY